MPGLEPTNLHPLPDDPWRASDHNVIVDQSVAVNEAFRYEHGDAGDHYADGGKRFPVAGGVAEWDPGTSAWVLLRSEGIFRITSISQQRFSIDLERPMQAIGSWGVIGSVDTTGAIDMVTTSKTVDHGIIRVPLGASLVGFLVVGPHAPL